MAKRMRLGEPRDIVVLIVILAVGGFLFSLDKEGGRDRQAGGNGVGEDWIGRDEIYINDETRPHVSAIVAGVNRLAREHPLCQQSIAPGSVGISPSKTAAYGKTMFFVHCGSGSSIRTIYFE